MSKKNKKDPNIIDIDGIKYVKTPYTDEKTMDMCKSCDLSKDTGCYNKFTCCPEGSDERYILKKLENNDN